MPATARRAPLGLFAAAVALLLPLVFSPSTYSPFWAPKNALLPLVVAVGLPLLLLLTRTADDRRLVARAGVALVAVSALSAALSRTPRMAVVGVYGFGTGLLFVTACAAAWAIGASLDERSRDDVRGALVVAVLVNAAVAVLQVLIDLQAYHLALLDDRAFGLMANPIHLGALVAGGVALLSVVDRSRFPAALAGLALCGAALEVSGTRSALLATLVVVAAGWRRIGTRRSAAVVVALAVGFVLGTLAAQVGQGETASGRLADAGGGGLHGRVAYWELSGDAVADRPLLGSGPGTYRSATSPHRNVDVARAWGADGLYADAHNLVVEYAVTTGLVGLAAAAAFVGLAGRRARGPLAAFALGVLVVQLFEPQFPGTSVPALLALGAAGARHPRRLPRPALAVTAVLGVAAVAATASLLLGEVRLEQARLDFVRSDARAAADLLPLWPEPLVIRGRIELFRFRTEGERAAGPAAVRYYRQAVDRDPLDPFLWKQLAAAESASGRLADATRHYERALRLNPVSIDTLNSLGDIAVAQERYTDASRWYEASLDVIPTQPEIREQLADLP